MKRKVDPIALEKMVRDGLSQRQISERLNVREGTISKNIKLLNFASSKDICSKVCVQDQ